MCIFLAAGAVGAGIATSLSAGAALAANVAVAAIPAIIGGAIQIAGQVQAGQAAKDQGKYEAKVARYEAVLAKQAGDVEQFKFGIQAQREFGRLMLAQATSSKDLSFGNAAAQQIEVRKFQTFDKDIIARNVDARVLSLQLTASNAITRGRNQAIETKYAAGASGIGILVGITSAFTNVGYASGGFGDARGLNEDTFGTPSSAFQLGRSTPSMPAPRAPGSGWGIN